MSNTGFRISDNRDLVQVFTPIGTNTPISSDTRYFSTTYNSDLARIFSPYIIGTRAPNTNYRIFDGRDLSQIFQNITTNITWTERTSAGSRRWYGIASSIDGTRLAAVVDQGNIFTSTNGGANWTARTSAGTRSW